MILRLETVAPSHEEVDYKHDHARAERLRDGPEWTRKRTGANRSAERQLHRERAQVPCYLHPTEEVTQDHIRQDREHKERGLEEVRRPLPDDDTPRRQSAEKDKLQRPP